MDEYSESSLEDLSYNDLLLKAKELNSNLINYKRRAKPQGVRYGKTHPAQIDDVKIYTTVNRDENGEIIEIYISTDREGTIITGLLNSLSKSISVMLQYHVPPQDISRMLRGQMYEPHGFVQRHPYIKYVSSISDLISKIIDIELGDYTRCQVKPDSYEKTPSAEIAASTQVASVVNTSSIRMEEQKTYSTSSSEEHGSSKGERVYGSVCPTCSSTRMVRNGTCMLCQDCGSTTGCS